MKPFDRDKRVVAILERIFEKATKKEHPIAPDTETALQVVFNSTTWGFREIVLVIAIAKLIDPAYKASSSFYDCNPRALYEGPIRGFLLHHGIPHKKSGPLNVAKATVGINDQWAAQRRPPGVAQRVVQLVKHLETLTQDELEVFGINLASKFLKEASRVQKLVVEIRHESQPENIYRICRLMIENVPDAGNTAQRIVGLLLQSYHEDLQTGLKVSGYQDRASVTSTTSKKPGDLMEEQLDGTVIRIYEVTGKSFGPDRVRESYETVRAYDKLTGGSTSELIVICRPEDVHPEAKRVIVSSPIFLGTFTHGDLAYYFINIHEWVMGQLLRMTDDGRFLFYQKLHEYVSDPNTAEKVKLFWKSLHSKE